MLPQSTEELLYNPLDEHDACGVGFVANVSGRASHDVVCDALEALCSLKHRGAVDAEGRTGDGAGLLTQFPQRFISREVQRLGLRCERELGVGMFFLPRNPSAAARCRDIARSTCESRGLITIGWRLVPVDETVLGPRALAAAPVIEQLIVARGQTPENRFEDLLYGVRRTIEAHTAEIDGFYIASMSSRTIVYKGLCVGDQLGPFYKDLGDPDFQSSLAVFHQRYSTNTFPNWALAQPFRLLAHNGEINTICGNRNWMRARELEGLSSGEPPSTGPVLWSKGSDSASLDNALELLTMSGREIMESTMILMPEAYERSADMPEELRNFYDYAACLTEPWDGPAAVAFTDGRIVGARLDRNGLRPARYAITDDGRVIVASEVGVINLDPQTIIEKGRLGPGQMIAVDVESGMLLTNAEINRRVSARRPYAGWVRSRVIQAPVQNDCPTIARSDGDALTRRLKSFGYTRECVDRILEPMLATGKEPVGSMGDDTPLAFMSSKPRLLYSYFKQRFAQVTNPAIDPIRERLVMSLTTLMGPRGAVAAEPPSGRILIKLSSPIISDATLRWIERRIGRSKTVTLPAMFDVSGDDGLAAAIDMLCRRAVEAADSGKSIIILDDLSYSGTDAPIPMLLAVGAVHNHLIREGRRMGVSLIARTGEARDDHHIACLMGCGANAVNPSLAFELIAARAVEGGLSVAEALKNYRSALEDGLLKIMAKMGISTVAGYCGSGTFEIIGIDRKVVEQCFTGIACRLSGLGLREIAKDMLRFRVSHEQSRNALEDAGFFRYRNGGEYHGYNPGVFRALHRAATTGDAHGYERYAAEVSGRPPTVLRDLIDYHRPGSVVLDEVESAESIVARFSTSGMSQGALSRNAHETLAVAMNRLGARSNSGEGGEDRRRFKRRPGGDLANSRIKQVASARFGVTPEYLVSADELEIKIAQGSKPGEGGQLPGDKVTAEIAAIRHSVPGVTLISPPPHHDIYSIEDLAQLIYDLRQINPEARIAVKLVSEAGIGTIAAGVAKAGADLIHISGHDGGTGASPLGSMKNAGTPWELGLAETQQALMMNDLRSRVRLRVDGGMKTGRDVIIAAMLGAEEFGFATAAVVALGCVMARQCHLNTCPVGIATQDPTLRRKFNGNPHMVVKFFTSLAEDVRALLAEIGFRSLDEAVGRSDLMFQKQLQLPKQVSVDLGPMLGSGNRDDNAPRRFTGATAVKSEAPLQDAVESTCSNAILDGSRLAATFEIRNTDRTIGAGVAGKIARRYGAAGLPDATIDLTFVGSAGQSFGAFNTPGLRLSLIGEANDYVGKGMSGGEIVIRPSSDSRFEWCDNVILGNTVMYGATGGSLFAAGRAGERFCVRNSGGVAIVEGVGSHGCEYMTGGVVVVLGEVGPNFAAGMTGGSGYVYDEHRMLGNRCNQELVEISTLRQVDVELVRTLVERHYEATSSRRAGDLLSTWQTSHQLFWRVVTQAEASNHSMPELRRVDAQVLVAPATLAASERADQSREYPVEQEAFV